MFTEHSPVHVKVVSLVTARIVQILMSVTEHHATQMLRVLTILEGTLAHVILASQAMVANVMPSVLSQHANQIRTAQIPQRVQVVHAIPATNKLTIHVLLSSLFLST
jgi:hypothetical protein